MSAAARKAGELLMQFVDAGISVTADIDKCSAEVMAVIQSILGTDSLHEYTFDIYPITGKENFKRRLLNFATSITAKKDGEAICSVIYDPAMNELFFATKGEGAYIETETGVKKLTIRPTTNLINCLAYTGFSDRDGDPVEIDDVTKLLSAVRVVKNFSCTALSMCWIISNRGDILWQTVKTSGEIEGAVLLCREAGCVVRDYTDHDWSQSSQSVIVCNPTIYPQFIQARK